MKCDRVIQLSRVMDGCGLRVSSRDEVGDALN